MGFSLRVFAVGAKGARSPGTGSGRLRRTPAQAPSNLAQRFTQRLNCDRYLLGNGLELQITQIWVGGWSDSAGSGEPALRVTRLVPATLPLVLLFSTLNDSDGRSCLPHGRTISVICSPNRMTALSPNNRMAVHCAQRGTLVY
jgi:hypothetical protein